MGTTLGEGRTWSPLKLGHLPCVVLSLQCPTVTGQWEGVWNLESDRRLNPGSAIPWLCDYE